MLGWNSSFNWTRSDLENVLQQTFLIEKRDSVCLDVEHSDSRNMDDLLRWAREMGYNAAEKNSDIIRVWK